MIGHRGVRGDRPENTLVAIRAAHERGADAVEIDVRPCATGEIVVFHDPDFARMTGDPRTVAEVSFEELRSLRLEGEPIPTLGEVLALTSELGLGLNVEIKHDTPSRWRAARGVAEVLASGLPRQGVIVSSFDPLVLAVHRALRPELCHAQLVHASSYHDFALLVARLGHADGVHLERTLFEAERVAPFLRGRFASVWTVNDPDEARRFADLGAEAIITDVPEVIGRALGPG